MSTSALPTPRLAARRCWMQGRRVYLEITDRRSISFPASKYDRLAYASQVELAKIQLHDDGRAIRWESIDEEILVEDVAHQVYVHTARREPLPGTAPAGVTGPKSTF